MKKALSFAVALGLVAGMASSAMAEDMLSIKGDARLRGVYSTNTSDQTDAAADKVQEMDQRYRLNATIKINDDVKVSTRLVLTDGDQLFGTATPVSAVTADRYNINVKAFGGSWTVGRMDGSWGNKFLGWGASPDRIKAVYKVGDLTTAYYLQKNSEGGDVFGDGDNDTWAALVIGKAGDTKWGVIGNYNIVDTVAAADKDTGYLLDGFFTTKAGGATVMGEFVYSGGDTLDNSAEDAFFGGFVGGAMGMDALTVKGLIAYYDGNEGGVGGRDCDNDFAPTLLIGTCQETAITEFGGTTTTPGDTTYLLTGGIDMKVNDKLTVGALLGYLMASENGVAGGDATMVEFDLTASYALAQNATYSFGIALGDVDEFSTADDSILVIGNRVDVKW